LPFARDSVLSFCGFDVVSHSIPPWKFRESRNLLIGEVLYLLTAFLQQGMKISLFLQLETVVSMVFVLEVAKKPLGRNAYQSWWSSTRLVL